MFGYVKPFKPELKICEFESYKAVYCGLCGQLGNSFGMAARLTLSYDFTFLSMLHFSLSGENPKISACRCFVNPLKKIPLVTQAMDSKALCFGADIAVIMLYYKLLDNIEDSWFPKNAGWSMLRPFVAAARKKAALTLGGADAIILESVRGQAEIESRKSGNLDEACEPTANAMSEICKLLASDEKQQRVLSRFGYFLGRFVYLCDALDDIEDDLKNESYNPLIYRFNLTKSDNLGKAREFAKESLYMTIGETVRAYDLLTLSSFRTVLDNVITLGLRASVDEILVRRSKKTALAKTG